MKGGIIRKRGDRNCPEIHWPSFQSNVDGLRPASGNNSLGTIADIRNIDRIRLFRKTQFEIALVVGAGIPPVPAGTNDSLRQRLSVLLVNDVALNDRLGKNGGKTE